MTQITRGTLFHVVLALCAICCGIADAQQSTVPVILRQPQSKFATIGGNVSFDVAIEPAPNVRFQWRLNGGNIPGAILSQLIVSNVQPRDAGIYTVAVFNDVGAVTSLGAELQLDDLPMVPFGDRFGGGPLLNGTIGLVQSDNTNATAETGEPFHAGNPPRHTVWATWVAPATAGGIVTFRTAGSGFDTVLAVYTGTLSAGLTEVVSDDDGAGFLTSQVSFRPQPQVPYHIVVDGYAGASGKFLFAWNFEFTGDPFPAFVTEPVDQTVAPGTDVTFEVTGVSSNYVWQWYFEGRPIPEQNSSKLLLKKVDIQNVGSYFCRGLLGNRFRDTRMARLQLNVNEFGIADGKALSTEKLLASRLRVDQEKAIKPKAVAHGYTGTQVFSTTTSTKEPGEPNHCGVAGGASEWFAYQAETNGTLYIDTDGSNFDTVLAVYVGPGDSYATLVPVACDNNSGLDGKDSRVQFPATAGTIYWIAVDGVNNPNTGQVEKGTVALHFHLVVGLRLSAMAYTNASGGKMIFKVTGTPNLPAIVQGSTNLNGLNWVSLATNSTATGIFNYTNSGANAFQYRYYRAVNQF